MKRALVASTLVVLVAAVGCARRPATTQASAPPPAGTSSATTPAPGGGGSLAVTSQGTPAAPGAPGNVAARPSIRDFAAVADVKDIHFAYDRYEILPAEARVLDADAAWLKANPNNLVLIEGHCDERGTNEYNVALGERRAKATMNYLVAHGVQAKRITVMSYGEERPVCNDHNEGCWSKNRRAHFLVKPM